MGLFKRWKETTESEPLEKEQSLPKEDAAIVEDVAWFKRIMSHNIRMPLAIIAGYSELLLSGSLETEEEKLVCVRNISKNIDFMNTLTKVVLDDNQDYLLEDKEEMDLLEAICDVTEYVKNIAKKSKIDIKVNSVDEQIMIKGNRIVIMRALFNLIENSLVHMKKSGEITITVQEQEEEVLVVYRDNGIGMEASEVENVLKLNYRGDSNEGTGLGMYLVAEAVKSHDGTIEVRSDVDKGFAVYITLPVNL